MCSICTRITERLFVVKTCGSWARAGVRLAGQPLRQFTDLIGHPLEALAVDDKKRPDDEDSEADLRHEASIARGVGLVIERLSMAALAGPRPCSRSGRPAAGLLSRMGRHFRAGGRAPDRAGPRPASCRRWGGPDRAGPRPACYRGWGGPAPVSCRSGVGGWGGPAPIVSAEARNRPFLVCSFSTDTPFQIASIERAHHHPAVVGRRFVLPRGAHTYNRHARQNPLPVCGIAIPVLLCA